MHTTTTNCYSKTISSLLVAASALLFAFACGETPTGDDGTSCDLETQCPANVLQSFCDLTTQTCIERPSPDACNEVQACQGSQRPFCSDAEDGECVECIASTDCSLDQACDQQALDCVDVQCEVGQPGDDFCSALDPAVPFCTGPSRCGECRDSSDCSDAAAPACQFTSLCGPCQNNSQCVSGQCDIDSGTCADDAQVIHVATTGGAGDCGSPETPCKDISTALGKVTDTRNIIVLEQGTYSGNSTIVNGDVTIIGHRFPVRLKGEVGSGIILNITGSANVTLEGLQFEKDSADSRQDYIACANSDATVNIRFSSFVDGFRAVQSKCTTTIENSSFENNLIGAEAINGGSLVITDTSFKGTTTTNSNGGAVACSSSSSSLTLKRLVIQDSLGNGVSALNCSLSVDATHISGVGKAAIRFNGNDFSITNSIIVNNQNGVTINHQNQAVRQQFDFNTLANNSETGFDCNFGAPFTGVGNIIEQGSLPNVFDSTCRFKFSNIKGGPAGAGNVDVLSGFVAPTVGNDSDYHLKSSSPLLDKVPTTETDLMTDFDGDLRPGNGKSDIGADEAN